MLSKVTLANSEGTDIVLHEDTIASRRLLLTTKGLVGVGPLRDVKRSRPQAHGSINDTHFEEGRTIQFTGEVWSTEGVIEALKQFREVTQVLLESLDNGGALLKWTEGASGLKLQMEVQLDSEIEPTEEEAAAVVKYAVSLFAEDPRAYSQTLSSSTGATITGGEVNNAFISTLPVSNAIAVDATFIYWGTEVGIGRAKLNGTSVEPEWIKTEGAVTSVVVNATNVFWANQLKRCIGKATIAGGSIVQEFVTKASLGGECFSLAIDGTFLYYTQPNFGRIGRLKLAGTGVEKEWIKTEHSLNGGLAVNASNIFWGWVGGSTNWIGRAAIAGTGITEPFIEVGTGTGIAGIVLDATFLYWANFSSQTIQRSKLAGTEIKNFIVGAVGPFGLAINSEHIYWGKTTTNNIGRGTASPVGGEAIVAQTGNRPTPLTVVINGPIVNPAVINQTTNAGLYLTGEIPSGNFVEINTATRTVKLNGVASVLFMVNAQATDWTAFSPLASTGYILSGSSATAASMTVKWRNAYA